MTNSTSSINVDPFPLYIQLIFMCCDNYCDIMWSCWGFAEPASIDIVDQWMTEEAEAVAPAERG